MQVVKILIEDNFHLPLDLSEMAKAVNLSPWRLAHIFKAEVGISPLRYLALVRLQKARYYLETGFLTVREIGASVGFPNASHFTRSFKAAYGSSPVQHRSSNFRVRSVRDNVDPVNSPSGARHKKGGDLQAVKKNNRRN